MALTDYARHDDEAGYSLRFGMLNDSHISLLELEVAFLEYKF